MPDVNLSAALEISLRGFPAEKTTHIRDEISNLSAGQIKNLELLFHDNDDLDRAYMQIGVSAGNAAWGADALREGKRIFRNYRNKLQKFVCTNDSIREFCNNANNHTNDMIAVAALIAGGLAQDHTWNIDVVAAGVILAKMGVREFCKLEWQNLA